MITPNYSNNNNGILLCDKTNEYDIRNRKFNTLYSSDRINNNMTLEYTDTGGQYGLYTTFTPEELKKDLIRVRTFSSWPPQSSKTPYALAQNGFYSLGSGDRVKCAFCGISVHNWKKEDDIFSEHRRMSANCSFIKKSLIEANPAGFSPTSVKFHQYSSVERRLDSFFHMPWPMEKEQKPWDLAKAGFFCCGEGDKVKCYVCGGNLKNWDPTDIPMLEHKKWYTGCEYVKHMNYLEKNPSYHVEVTQEGSAATSQLQSTATVQAHNDDIDEQVNARIDMPHVQAILQRGYSEPVVRKAIKKQLTLTGDDFPNMTSLLAALNDSEEDIYGASSEASVPPVVRKTQASADAAPTIAPHTFAPPSDSSGHENIRRRGIPQQGPVEYAGEEAFTSLPEDAVPVLYPGTAQGHYQYLQPSLNENHVHVYPDQSVTYNYPGMLQQQQPSVAYPGQLPPPAMPNTAMYNQAIAMQATPQQTAPRNVLASQGDYIYGS